MTRKPIYQGLYFQVIVAILIGVVLGYVAPATGEAMKPLGDGFIKLIKMIIAPIIFCTVVVGIAGMEDMKQVGRTGDTRTEPLTEAYLTLLGKVAYQLLTSMTHPVVNLLAQQSRAPTQLDMDALVQAALYHQTVAHVPVTYYRNPAATDTSVPMEVHADTDAGECQALDGGGRGGLIVKAGPRGFPGGYIIAESKAVEHSSSTPGDEAWMLAHGVQTILVLRYFFQEIAGHHPNPYNTALTVPGHSAPTSFVAREDTAADIAAADPGPTGCPVNTLVTRWFRGGGHPLSLGPPSDVFQDSEVVGDIVASEGRTKRLKALRSYLRFFRMVYTAINDQHITVTTGPSGANAANGRRRIPSRWKSPRAGSASPGSTASMWTVGWAT